MSNIVIINGKPVSTDSPTYAKHYANLANTDQTGAYSRVLPEVTVTPRNNLNLGASVHKGQNEFASTYIMPTMKMLGSVNPAISIPMAGMELYSAYNMPESANYGDKSQAWINAGLELLPAAGGILTKVASKTPVKKSPSVLYQYLKNHLTKADVEIPDYITNKLDFSNVNQSQWYKDLVTEYGQKRADYIVKNIQSEDFNAFFLKHVDGYNPDKEMASYNKAREILTKLGGDPNKGKGVLGGSASMMNEGTVNRVTAAPHDLDFRAYIGNSKKTAAKKANTYSREDIAPLFNKDNINSSPILETLVTQFPDKFKKASVMDLNKTLPKWFVPRNKSNQIYATPMINQGNTGVSRTFMTQIDGVPVDLFLTDNKINGTYISPASETLYWKDLWNKRRSVPREKDVMDIKNFKPFSSSNPVINVGENTSQFAPFNFSDQIINKEGFPVVHKVETYPGSKNFVPAVMNWKGEFKSPTTSKWNGPNFYKEGGDL